MFPPSVPALRVWAAPCRRNSSPRSGWRRGQAQPGLGEAHAGPDVQMVGGLADDAAACGTRPSQITGSSTRRPFVTQRATSVAPATIVASGCSAMRSTRAWMVAGAKKRRLPRRPRRSRRRAGPAAGRGCRRGRRRRRPARGRPAPARRPARSARSRCSGRDCRRARRRSGSPRSRPPRSRRPVLGQREQRHHEARRAEAALRAVLLHHRRWTGCRVAVGPAQVLHGEKLAAVELTQEGDAGIDRAVAQALGAGRALGAHHDHGAGPAIALVAALLGADQPLGAAQPVEHRQRRVAGLDRAQLMAEEEADRVSHAASRVRTPIRRPRTGRSRPGYCGSLSSMPFTYQFMPRIIGSGGGLAGLHRPLCRPA